MKSILVIGMGRFGKYIATKLQELGNDVMIVDKDDKLINDLSPSFTNAFIGDCTNETVIKRLGVNNFDICIVAIGNNFQSSLEITFLLKNFGAKYVVSKSDRDIQAKFLKQNGADEVVYIERDMAYKLATKYNSNNIFDYIDLGSDFAIVEIPLLNEWIGKTIAQVDVRKNYNLNILAVKNNSLLTPISDANYIFKKDDHLVTMGHTIDIKKITKGNNKVK